MTEAIPGPIRVFLVDDQAMVRAGFRMLVESQSDMEVVGEAGDGRAAVEELARTPADVVLMDVRMPRMDGVEATARITSQATAQITAQATAQDAAQDAVGGETTPRVIVLTTFDLDEYAFAAIRAGASAFLLKDATPPVLLEAIRSVRAGDSVVAPSTTRRLLDHFAALPAEAPVSAALGNAGLTARELEVLTLVARGRSNSEIAADLVVAEATVKTHIGRLLAKTGVRDRVQLVVLAYEVGLVGRAPGSPPAG